MQPPWIASFLSHFVDLPTVFNELRLWKNINWSCHFVDFPLGFQRNAIPSTPLTFLALSLISRRIFNEIGFEQGPHRFCSFRWFDNGFPSNSDAANPAPDIAHFVLYVTVFQRNAVRADHLLIEAISMMILLLFVRTRSCDRTKKLSEIGGKFDDKTSSFPSKFRLRDPISVEHFDDKTSCFPSKFRLRKSISIRNLIVSCPPGDEIPMIRLVGFHRNFVSENAFRIRNSVTKCISYTNGNLVWRNKMRRNFRGRNFVSPLIDEISISKRENGIGISYTNEGFRIRNEDFVYEIKGWRRNFVYQMRRKDFVNELSYRGGYVLSSLCWRILNSGLKGI